MRHIHKVTTHSRNSIRRPTLEQHDQLRVQGTLALCDCGPRDGGFVCIPGAHANLRRWAHSQRDRRDDLPPVTNPLGPIQFHVPKDDLRRSNAQKVPVREGSLCIWNSKLPHANFPNDSPNMRIVMFIKMASALDTATRPIFTNPSLLPPVSQFQLTPLGRKLLGFGPWGDRDEKEHSGETSKESES